MPKPDKAPRPLVPVECDVQHLPYMPLSVDAFLNSDLFLEATDEEFRGAVTAWMRAWKQVPASSLPNDDRKLAALLNYGRDIESFKAIKSQALRGFVACSDGRLYHPLIAEHAIKAWRRSQAMSKGGKASAAKRKASANSTSKRAKSVSLKQQQNQQDSKHPANPVGNNGNGKGKGKETESSPNTVTSHPVDPSVEASASEARSRAPAPAGQQTDALDDDIPRAADLASVNQPPQPTDILCRDRNWFRPSELDMKRWSAAYPHLDVESFLRHMALWASNPRPTKTAQKALPQSRATAPRAVAHWLRSEGARPSSKHLKQSTSRTRGQHHGIQQKDYGPGTAEDDLPASLRA